MGNDRKLITKARNYEDTKWICSPYFVLSSFRVFVVAFYPNIFLAASL